jgi:Carboxypeptidase regulatory-like domain
MRWFLCFFILISTAALGWAAETNDLKLLISIDQATVTSPFPARIILHLHNSGKQPLLLYSPVRDASVVSGAVNPFITEDAGPGSTSGGSALEIHLVPMNSAAPETAGEGRVLESAGLPHPKLLAIAPGDDDEEKTVVSLSPAPIGQSGAQRLWGQYKLSVTYRAHYSNGANLARILDANIWEGEIESNSIVVDLKAPSAGGQASVSGSVLGVDMQPVFGALVTLSDREEQVLRQSAPDANGKFSFTQVPFGFYWLTARHRDSSEDATVFRHVQLSPNEPTATVQLVMLQPEVYHAQQLRHKPVLFRIFNKDDQPAAGVSLEDTWSSGTVLDKVKGATDQDGTATLELIPGRNYLTLRRSGCAKQDERVDVAAGGGIDGFKLVFACAKR